MKEPKLKMPHFIIIGAILVGTIIAVIIMIGSDSQQSKLIDRVNGYLVQLKGSNTKPISVEKEDVNFLLDIVTGRIQFQDKATSLNVQNVLNFARASDGSFSVDEVVADITNGPEISKRLESHDFKNVIRTRSNEKETRTAAFHTHHPVGKRESKQRSHRSNTLCGSKSPTQPMILIPSSTF